MGKIIKQALDDDNQSPTDTSKQAVKKAIQESIHEIIKIAKNKGISLHECIYGTTNLLDEVLNPGMCIINSNLDKKRYHTEHHIMLE